MTRRGWACCDRSQRYISADRSHHPQIHHHAACPFRIITWP
ncbi:MAG TPA: hypothetical protein PK971_11030 [Saprospiraceae bacterium]|nr:hypothetical protein [Saprospiraceae bacterium]